ncbi:triose-phosphate isomerase [Limosilactobacillus reuteri]|uniref:triose-phosphate isomerase n=1 Tax=Limosilactobacillus reuteri TaxID=1598 RepID=UPI001E5D463C|nr:triose-phosphate isomerase [Limosilactobacillus reuteri]MCC4348680.1 triose-phosphate isomerase [Limosilactobacillus reuteri]MCC4375738.1 triose-phosphate isomerase [Limosilactobacillus reuteri]MCC4385883.1 triose-phosphate isomerase [Limosilactobacillus reuteri]
MRKPFIIANWKMNKNVHESVAFVKAIKEKLPADKEIGIAAQAVSLYNMKKVAGSSNLQIIAQNASAELEGPYTGEISMRSLADAGVTYVMLGHLERRRLFNESNDSINQKVLAALNAGIIPIICTDEEMVQTEVNGQIHYVFRQLKSVLKGVPANKLSRIVISYEPSWAVGSTHQANPDIAEEGCQAIRQSLVEMYGNEIGEQVRILYGGSVNPENISQIMSKPNVDGALIGRASLEIESFLQMINYIELASKQKLQVI